jgi:hypothetical protein
MRLPNGDRAVVDMTKLREYCLSETHPRGKHKARVFAGVLGLSADGADILHDALLGAARSRQAVLIGEDEFGQRWRVDFAMTHLTRRAPVRSFWIVRRDEDFPRFVTCYVTQKVGVE